MKLHERQLQDLQRWCQTNGAGMEILFAGHSISIIDDIPCPWQITMGRDRNDREIYHAYGASMEDAISRCHDRWQAGQCGHMQRADRRTGLSLGDWFDFQQNKDRLE